jgi:acyl-CoA synthetase (AMP-forming)/AMP-acid ligase II
MPINSIMSKEQVHSHYAASFEATDQPFLHYYAVGKDKQLIKKVFSRKEFFELALRAAGVLKSHGLKPGDHFINCFGSNHYQDMAFRLAAVMTGIVPATVNWQADSLDRVQYKIDSTQAKLILFDALFDSESLKALKKAYSDRPFFDVEQLDGEPMPAISEIQSQPDHSDTRIVIFTSGTTGEPKGVQLPYLAYETNHCTFESMLDIKEDDRLALIIVNPLHHTNSTAITDWGMRRKGAKIHLVQKYSTQYWALNVEIADKGYSRIVAPLVAKHFDFLESLNSEDKLPVPLESLTAAMSKIDYLIGSAPVGPTTVKRLLKYAGRVPTVRFGSTETCLQVMGIPAALNEDTKSLAMEVGWNHEFEGRKILGYYIGRQTPPFTECKIVKAIDRQELDYFKKSKEGEPGYLVTRGKNLMTGYLGNPEATEEVFHDGGWYSGLKDICFYLKNPNDGGVDFYWQGRDSFLLIKGGANYAYDQINAELSDFVEEEFGLEKSAFEIAVVGLKINSEHDDDCCVTMHLNKEISLSLQHSLTENFISLAKKDVAKGSAPDYFRFGEIPKNFKGAVLVPELKKTYLEFINNSNI